MIKVFLAQAQEDKDSFEEQFNEFLKSNELKEYIVKPELKMVEVAYNHPQAGQQLATLPMIFCVIDYAAKPNLEDK